MSEVKKDDHGSGGGMTGGKIFGIVLAISAGIAISLILLGIGLSSFSTEVGNSLPAGQNAERHIRLWLAVGGTIMVGLLLAAFVGVIIKNMLQKDGP